VYGYATFWGRPIKSGYDSIKAGYEYVEPFLRGWGSDAVALEDRLVVFPRRESDQPTSGSDDRFAIGSVVANTYRVPEAGGLSGLTLWRLVRAGADPLYTAPRPYDSRWFRVGASVVMAAGGLMEGLMEATSRTDVARPDLVALRLQVPSIVSVRDISETELPEDFSRIAFAATQQIGAEWLSSRSSCILSVPSALVPNGRMYAINPTHPDFHRITIGAPLDLPDPGQTAFT
jgi:RES domain-containing protein